MSRIVPVSKVENISPDDRDTSIISKALRHAKRFIVIVVGFTILFVGIALIVLPGPAIFVIPLGLSILATELLWARKLFERIKNKFQ